MKTPRLFSRVAPLAAAILFLSMPTFAASPSGSLPRSEEGGGLGAGEYLVGTAEGLFKFPGTPEGGPVLLWKGGGGRKILRAEAPEPGFEGWYILCSRAVLYSSDLVHFEERSTGLPSRTYKRIVEGQKVFERELVELKDLELDASGRMLIACTKDAVYLSRDGARNWESLGTPSPTTGLKAAVLAPLPESGETGAWVSHPIKGLFARSLKPGSPWVPVGSGLFSLPGMSNIEEVADLRYVGELRPETAAAKESSPEGVKRAVPAGSFWASNSFQGRIYRAAAASGNFSTVWSDGRDFGSVESLCPLSDGGLRFLSPGFIGRLDPVRGSVAEDSESLALVRAVARALPTQELDALAWNEGGRSVALSELWLLSPTPSTAYRSRAENHHGIYLATNLLVNPTSRAKYFALLKDRGLDSLVVDMKDDFGRLRFTPRDPLLKKLGTVANGLDVEAFVAEAKAKGLYLIARIVVFKDEALASYGGSRYAVWDEKAKAPWRGYRTVRTVVPSTPPSGAPNPYGPTSPSATPSPPLVLYERKYYGEHWVDPYSEEVWAYNVAIANEIVERGFDEVQFDYIRFPTDGENLDAASYRWRDPGLDKESALVSFLRFARERIDAPISIDIYGANGWYRSGLRTGQDVELLSNYVDVICPMFYPSHFEQDFLAEAPAEERPYRIYRFGSLRNEHIARGRATVRPYVQAFYLNVSYDKLYYDLDYVKREIAGIRDATNLGMTFWNNAGRYDDVPRLEYGSGGRLSGAAGWKGAAGSAPASGSTTVNARTAADTEAPPDPGILE